MSPARGASASSLRFRRGSPGTARPAPRLTGMPDLTPLLALTPYLAFMALLIAIPAAVLPRFDRD